MSLYLVILAFIILTKCSNLATLTQWVMQFVIAKSTPYMITSMSYGTYFFFAASMNIAFVWVFFLLPETKGVRLEEMDALFGTPGEPNFRNREGSLQGEIEEDGAKGMVVMRENI